jgi:hypothetical protein
LHHDLHCCYRFSPVPNKPPLQVKEDRKPSTEPLSRLHIVGKPTSVQFAYAGYKDNIEAFLHSTYVGKKVIVGAGLSYPITTDFTDIPLRSPASMAAFKKPPSQTTKDAMAIKWAPYLPKFEVTKKKSQVNILFEGSPTEFGTAVIIEEDGEDGEDATMGGEHDLVTNADDLF